MKNWYIIQTKPLMEAKVHTLLGMASVEAFYPRVREPVYRGGVSYSYLKSLFPTYLFVHIDFEKDRNFNLIRYTRGVSKILCVQNRPVLISSKVIAAIQARTGGTGIVDYRVRFRQGDRIRVTKGVLKDLVGILERPSSEDDRVRVLLELANYKMQAMLHCSEIAKMAAI